MSDWERDLVAVSEWLLVSGCQWDIYLSMCVAELGNECARHGVGHLDLCAGLECDWHLASQLHSQSCQILQPVTPPLRAILGIRHVLCSSHSHTLIVVGGREGKVKLFNYPDGRVQPGNTQDIAHVRELSLINLAD